MKSIKKRIIVIILTLILCSTSTIIIPYKTTVVSASETEGVSLDNDLIRRITENMSNVIYDAYDDNDLRKGRAFGSKGEHYAADYLYNEMVNIGLSNVQKDKIEDVPGSDDLIQAIRDGDGNLTTKLDVIELGGTLNNSGYVSSVDCYISPRWNDSINNASYDKNLLTHNFTYNNLKIIQAEDYTCNDSFLKNVYIDLPPIRPLIPENLPFFNNIQDYKILRNLTKEMEDEFEEYYDFTFDAIDPDNPNTFPSFLSSIDNVSGGFVFIEEYPKFHPTIQELPSLENHDNYCELYIWTLLVKRKYDELRMRAWAKTYPTCKGLIWYDYLDDAYDTGQKGSYHP